MAAIISPGDAYYQFGLIPQSWWAGAVCGPSVYLPDGRTVFFFGQSVVVEDETLGDLAGQAQPNSVMIADEHGVTLQQNQPIPDGEDGSKYGPIGAALLSDGSLLVCCEGLSEAGKRTSTAACLMSITDSGVVFTRWLEGWPNATGDPDSGGSSMQAQVVYHCPVVVPSTTIDPDTLVVFGTQSTSTGARLWYATVPVNQIESYDQWSFASSSIGFAECDATCTAWMDAAGFHVASAQDSSFERAVLYESPTLDGTWERTLWSHYGSTDLGEKRRRFYVHPHVQAGDQTVLWSVSRIWEDKVEPNMHRPFWGTGATIGLGVTLGVPIVISGKGCQPNAMGTITLSGPGLTDLGDGSYLVSDTGGDETPITNATGYAVSAAVNTGSVENPSGTLLTVNSVSGVANLQGFTVVTNPDGTSTVYTFAPVG